MNYKVQRKRVVDDQFLARGIKTDLVIGAFYKVMRFRFVSVDMAKMQRCIFKEDLRFFTRAEEVLFGEGYRNIGYIYGVGFWGQRNVFCLI